ncbi:MAG: DUF2092 domain-containing protein [Sulfurovum sp.]|nr:DUF2092 domain-containing protein [Sulfurovum sp.]
MIDVKKVVGVVSLALLLGSNSLLAEGSAASVEQTQKNASTLLKNTYAYISSLQKYAFDVSITNTVILDNDEIVIKRHSDVEVQRDGMFRVDTKGDNINRSVYLASGVFTLMDNDEKYYATVKTGKGIDGTLDHISKKLGIVLPISTLIHSDMSKYIKPSRVQYFGTRVLSGVNCDYIAFRQKNTIVHLWVEDSSTPFIRAAKIVTEGVGSTDMILDWDNSPGFSNSTFMFKAPRGATNVSMRPVK